jgi:chemotaxis protein MotB
MPDQIAPAPVYIIKKKKGGHGGHHGGAWKVAYADFVTAMMALFIVLWLLSSSEDVKKAIGGYFQDPTGVGKLQGNSSAGTGDALELKKEDIHKVKQLVQQAIQQMVQFKKAKDNILMTVTGEGLRIELVETKGGMFFQSGNIEPSPVGRELLVTLAVELGTLPNRILIEGHTDATPFSATGAYSNWELSVDRGNAARRVMQANGLKPNQVMEVRGFADQDLRTPNDPSAASNRRISVIVKYVAPAQADLIDAKADRAEEKPEEAGGKPGGKTPEKNPAKAAEKPNLELAKSEPGKSEPAKSESPKSESPKSESAKSELPKPGPAKPVPAKSDLIKKT